MKYCYPPPPPPSYACADKGVRAHVMTAVFAVALLLAADGAHAQSSTTTTLSALVIEGVTDYIYAPQVNATLTLKGFDSSATATAVGAIETNAVVMDSAPFTSFGEPAVSADGSVVTLTLTIGTGSPLGAGAISPLGVQVRVTIRAGENFAVESQTDINIASAYFIYRFRDITELNKNTADGASVVRGSGAPLPRDATIYIPFGGSILLELYPMQIGWYFGRLNMLLSFQGGDASLYRMQVDQTNPIVLPLGQDGLVNYTWILRSDTGDPPDSWGVIRIPAADRISNTTFTIALGRSNWPVIDFPLNVNVRTVPLIPDVAVYPIASAAAELSDDASRSLPTDATASSPTSIAAFAIADDGRNSTATTLTALRVKLTPVDGDASELRTMLQAFTFVLRDLRVPGASAESVRARMRLVEKEGALLLEANFGTAAPGFGDASPRILDGETAYYEIVAHYSDPSVRIDERRGAFAVDLIDDSVDFLGVVAAERINTSVGFDVAFEVRATQFQISHLRTRAHAPIDIFSVDNKIRDIHLYGQFYDATGVNVDTDVTGYSVVLGALGLVGVLRKVGTTLTVEVTPSDFDNGRLIFNQLGGLDDFIEVLRTLGGGADSADGSRWQAAVRLNGVLGPPHDFEVDVVSAYRAPTILDLRLARKLEHGVASFITFTPRLSGLDVSRDSADVSGACFVAEQCETVEVERVLDNGSTIGFRITPILNEDYVFKSDSSLVLTFHLDDVGTALLPAVRELTLGAEHLAADSVIGDFDVLPASLEVFFEQREYTHAEDAGNVDIPITGRPIAGRRGIPDPLPAWRVRVEFDPVMTGFADWPASIRPSPAGFVELNFNSAVTQLPYSVPIRADTTYKPRETMDLRIVSAHFIDGDVPVRINTDAGFAMTTLVVADDDTVDVNLGLYENRNDADPSAALEFFERNATAAYMRVSLTETDGGADYYDAAGGAGTITLTFSGESTLCPSNLDDLDGLPIDLCARPVRDANYTLAAGDSTGTVHLSYTRDGEHEFWLELVAPADGVDESTPTITFDISAISVGGDPFQKGTVAGSVTIFDLTAGSAVPFVLDYDQSGNVNISDGLILGRLVAGIIAFETNFSSILNRFFAENAPPGTLVADSMLLNLISEEATPDAERLLSDRTLRDQALQSVLFIYFNYSDDLDLDKSGNLNISDGLILGRLVAGVIAAEVSFGPGFPNFFNPDGSLNKGLDPGTLDLFYVDVEADATGILPNEAVRREAIEKVLEIYVRAGFSFTD